MIPADVHMHQARVCLGKNCISVPELTDEELRDIHGQIAFLSHYELKVSIHDKVEGAALSEAEEAELSQSLEEFSHLFDGQLCHTSLVEHTIEAGSAKPVSQPPYHTSPEKRRIIGEQVTEILADGIIEPADGPWASHVVIMDRQTPDSSDPQFCVDYRKVNRATVKDSYPLSRVDESLNFLAWGKYISTLNSCPGVLASVCGPRLLPQRPLLSVTWVCTNSE